MKVYRTNIAAADAKFQFLAEKGQVACELYTLEFTGSKEISLSGLDEYVIISDTPLKIMRFLSNWFVTPLKSI